MSDYEERQRLLSYFSHRYVTLMTILKDVVRSKRFQKNSNVPATSAVSANLPAAIANAEANKRFVIFNKDLYEGHEN